MITNKKTGLIILSSLVFAFLALTLFVVYENSFIITSDNFINSWVAGYQSTLMTNFMLFVTNIGDIVGTIIIFLVFGSFLLFRERKSFYVFTIATPLGVVLAQVIKHLIQRVRPYNLLEQGYGFPSSHSTVAAIFLLSSIFLIVPLIKNSFSRKTFAVVASIFFPLVALSRIYLSVHWASDVVAGIILGSMCFIIAGLLCCHKKENVL